MAGGRRAVIQYPDNRSRGPEVQLIPMLYDWIRIAVEAETHQTLLPARG